MLGNKYECKHMFLCGSMNEPKCVDYGGRISESGRRVDCYKNNSFLYKTIKTTMTPLRKIKEGLARVITEGIIKAEGIDD